MLSRGCFSVKMASRFDMTRNKKEVKDKSQNENMDKRTEY